ncbi:MAG: O-antigen ligase family protein [Thermomicrobiales bacterium]
MLGLAALIAIVVFVAGLYSTSISVGCVLLSVPLQDAGALSIGGTTLTWTKVVVGAAVLAWLIRMLAEPADVRLDATSVAFLALVVILMVSVINAQSRGAWAGEVYRWAIALVVYLMATSATRDSRYPAVVVGASAIAVIGASAIGLGQVITSAGPPSFESRGLTRAYGAFGEPNPFAGYLEMTVPLFGALVVFGSRERYLASPGRLGRCSWWLAAVAVCLGGVALAFTQSRGGLVGLSAGVLVILVLQGRWLRWMAIGGTVLAVALLVVTPLGSQLANGVIGSPGPQQVTPANFAVYERLAHWKTGVAMVREHPITGIGAGNFSDRYREFAQVWRFRISRGHAHNTYIHMAAQSGLLGLLCYAGLLGTVAWRLTRSYRHCRNPGHRALIAGACGVTAAVVVHGFFDYLHVLSLGLQLSVVWAMANLGDGE